MLDKTQKAITQIQEQVDKIELEGELKEIFDGVSNLYFNATLLVNSCK